MAMSAPSSSGGDANPTNLRPPGSSRYIRDFFFFLFQEKAVCLWLFALWAVPSIIFPSCALASLHFIQHPDLLHLRDGLNQRSETDADR